MTILAANFSPHNQDYSKPGYVTSIKYTTTPPTYYTTDDDCWGASADALSRMMKGQVDSHDYAFPLDMADFRRCVIMLENKFADRTNDVPVVLQSLQGCSKSVRIWKQIGRLWHFLMYGLEYESFKGTALRWRVEAIDCVKCHGRNVLRQCAGLDAEDVETEWL